MSQNAPQKSTFYIEGGKCEKRKSYAPLQSKRYKIERKKNMSKRIISVIMALVLSLSMFTAALAVDNDSFTDDDSVKIPAARYYYTVSTIQDISINSNRATCSSTVLGNTNVTKIEIYMYLERLDGSSWVIVNQWSGTFYSDHAHLSDTSWVFVTGHYFRTRCFYKVYCGTAYESFTNYSQSVYY